MRIFFRCEYGLNILFDLLYLNLVPVLHSCLWGFITKETWQNYSEAPLQAGDLAWVGKTSTSYWHDPKWSRKFCNTTRKSYSDIQNWRLQSVCYSRLTFWGGSTWPASSCQNTESWRTSSTSTKEYCSINFKISRFQHGNLQASWTSWLSSINSSIWNYGEY